MEAVSEESKVHVSDSGSALERSRTTSAEVSRQCRTARRTPAASLIRDALATGAHM